MVTKTIEESEKEGKQVYEIGYLLNSSIPEEKLGEEVSKMKSALEKSGAFLISDEMPKLRQLAYVMTKKSGGRNERFSTAYFGWLKFELSASSVAEVKSYFDNYVEIIRFLLMKTVRENSLQAVRPVFVKRVSEPLVKSPEKPAEQKSESKPSMTEAELDKTIAELVVE